MRNVEEVFSALKENLDQIMTNLEDGILLFTRDARAVLVSDSVERFLGLRRSQILGAEIHEVFDRTTLLGSTVRDAFDAGVSIVQEEITTETGRRVQISLDFIHDDRQTAPPQTLGALLTLHDLESVREIEERAGTLAPPGGDRQADRRRRSRGQEPHQRHRRAFGAVAQQARRLRRDAHCGTWKSSRAKSSGSTA